VQDRKRSILKLVPSQQFIDENTTIVMGGN
jgi:hypothetical protein